DPCNRFGQRERRPFCVSEIRRIAPCCHRNQTLIGLALLLHEARMHVDAHAAAIDLARSQVNKSERLRRYACVFRCSAERLQRFHHIRQDFNGVFHSCLHVCSPSSDLKYSAVTLVPSSSCDVGVSPGFCESSFATQVNRRQLSLWASQPLSLNRQSYDGTCI